MGFHCTEVMQPLPISLSFFLLLSSVMSSCVPACDRPKKHPQRCCFLLVTR